MVGRITLKTSIPFLLIVLYLYFFINNVCINVFVDVTIHLKLIT